MSEDVKGGAMVTACMGPFAVKRIFRFLDVGVEGSDWSLQPDCPSCALPDRPGFLR
jgi:hypothetical protein